MLGSRDLGIYGLVVCCSIFVCILGLPVVPTCPFLL